MSKLIRKFRHSFTLTGAEATGTSTVSDMLIKTLGPAPYRYVSGGSIMRNFAKSLGMEIHEFAEYNRLHPEKGYDKSCDRWLTTLGGTHDFVVCEGRLPHFFIPKAFHILFVCDEDIRVARRANDKNMDTETVRTNLRTRETADDIRYAKLYGDGVLWKESQYDMAIDTGLHSPHSIVQQILNRHTEWQKELGDDMFETDIEAQDGKVLI